MTTVSVIVPNYNHAPFLRRRLDSILGQTYQDFELILLDDCSTDESREILREYAGDPRARLEFNEKNSGTPYTQWNKGVRMAVGRYVWIAESDDYAEPCFLERLVAALDADPRVTFAYCRSRRVSANGSLGGFVDTIYFADLDPRRWASDFNEDGLDECRRHFVRFNTASNASAVVFRKDVYERVGGADESMRLCADWKLRVSMALQGRVAYVAEPLSCFRFHGESVRGRIGFAKMTAEHLAANRWVLDRVPDPDRRVLRGMYLAIALVWVPAVLSPRVPRELKRETLALVKAIDPHPALSVARFVPAWLSMKFSEAFAKVWYPLLDFTYKWRHATGLHRPRKNSEV
jgi:glycosyltransferase involved in cell wall biosynthesis